MSCARYWTARALRADRARRCPSEKSRREAAPSAAVSAAKKPKDQTSFRRMTMFRAPRHDHQTRGPAENPAAPSLVPAVGPPLLMRLLQSLELRFGFGDVDARPP